MVSFKINGKVYELPIGELYQADFDEYFEKGVISFDKISDKEKLYRTTDKLFGWVCRTLCMFEEDFLSPDLKMEKEDIRRRIDQVDRLQKFFYKQGNVDKSIQLINDFLEVMLEHYRKMMNQDVNKEKNNTL